MFKARLLFVAASAGLLLSACDHPLQIVGQGYVYSSSGERDCLLEAQPCTNLVVGEYHETYRASPREGWQFVGWENCMVETDTCRFDIPADVVKQYWGKQVGPLIARFEPIDTPVNGGKIRVLPSVILSPRATISASAIAEICGIG